MYIENGIETSTIDYKQQKNISGESHKMLGYC